MNRRAFLQKLGLAAAAVPVASSVVRLLEPVAEEAPRVVGSYEELEAPSVDCSRALGEVWRDAQDEIAAALRQEIREWEQLEELRGGRDAFVAHFHL